MLLPPVGLAFLIALRAIHLPTFRFVLEEDGLVETLQFFCFLGGAIVSALVARSRWRSGHRWQAALFALTAGALLFIAGEEIAWGQRLLRLETPEWLGQINDQEEITVHNISGVLGAFNAVLLLTSLYAVVADPLNWRFRFAERWDQGRSLFVPPLFLSAAFGTMVGFRVLRIASGPESQYTVSKLIEWAELMYAAGVLWFLWLAYRHVRDAGVGSTHSAGLHS